MEHQLELHHPDRETWTAICSCGRWSSRFALFDIAIDQTGDLKTIASVELQKRHQVHVAVERRDLP
jgi:hypothetical protein